MPIYEFRCKQCSTVNEFLSKMGDTGKTLACRSCGSKNLEKMLSVTSIPSNSFPDTSKACCGGGEEQCYSSGCDTGCCRR